MEKEFERNGILLVTSFSLLIETIQLMTRHGFFEIDDMMHYTLGVVLGYGAFVLLSKLYREIAKGE